MGDVLIKSPRQSFKVGALYLRVQMRAAQTALGGEGRMCWWGREGRRRVCAEGMTSQLCSHGRGVYTLLLALQNFFSFNF